MLKAYHHTINGRMQHISRNEEGKTYDANFQVRFISYTSFINTIFEKTPPLEVTRIQIRWLCWPGKRGNTQDDAFIREVSLNNILHTFCCLSSCPILLKHCAKRPLCLKAWATWFSKSLLYRSLVTVYLIHPFIVASSKKNGPNGKLPMTYGWVMHCLLSKDMRIDGNLYVAQGTFTVDGSISLNHTYRFHSRIALAMHLHMVYQYRAIWR